MKQLKVWLLLVLVFAAGLAGGVAATRIWVRHSIKDALQNPEVVRRRVERELAWQLRLDPQQRERVQEICGIHTSD